MEFERAFAKSQIAELKQLVHYGCMMDRKCDFCHQIREKQGLGTYGTNLAHFDCVPCSICQTTEEGRGLKFHNGTWSHAPCLKGETQATQQNNNLLDEQIRVEMGKLAVTGKITPSLRNVLVQRFGAKAASIILSEN